MHFNWFHILPGFKDHPELTHVYLAATVTLLIAIYSLAAYAVAGTPEESLHPDAKPTFKGINEFIVESLYGLVTTTIKNHGEKYVPTLGAFFLYILFNNLFGIIPGMGAATENFNTSFACGIIIFFWYNIEGLRENGINYLKHFLGPVWYMAPLLLCIELVSHMIRPVTLGARLAFNLKSDHEVLFAFLDLAGVFLVPVVFYALGIFVSFIQAFVFTLLSSVYISMATAHDH